MKITLLISENCPACERAFTALSNLKLNGRKLSFEITNIADSTINVIPIVPALFINDKLFSYGDVNTEKLTDYISGI
jgi:predicted thioredoxin/glutaredoxin